MASRCPNACSSVAAVFSPNPASPGYPSAESPTSASQSGTLAGRMPRDAKELVLVDDAATQAIDEHDALSDDRLAQVLVGREHAHLLDLVAPACCAGRERVVGFVAVHPPDDHPEGARCVFREVELIEQLRGYPLVRLVALVPVVANGPDRVVERDCDVRDGLRGVAAAGPASTQASPTVAFRSRPPASWGGLREKCARKSSYVPSTR